MPRAPRPSEKRRWFKITEDILDDPVLAECSADCFRFYIRLLAMLNRTVNKTGEIALSRAALNLCAGREQRRHSLSIASEGAEAGLYTMSVDGAQTLICVSKWPKVQGFRSEERRPDVGEMSDKKKKTKKKTNTKKKQKESPASPGLCLCPDRLAPEDFEKLTAWAEPRYTAEDCEAAFQRVHDWSHTNRRKRTSWWVVTKNAIDAGWALPGRGGGRQQTFEEIDADNKHQRRMKLLEEPHGRDDDRRIPGNAVRGISDGR